jgi:hypothetical protein
MKIELKTAITPKSFLAFVAFVIYQFASSENTYLTWINIGFAAILLVLGIDNPSVSKFFKEMGSIMLDFSGSPQLRLQKIQSVWQSFALLWMTTAEEVKNESEKNESKDLKV